MNAYIELLKSLMLIRLSEKEAKELERNEKLEGKITKLCCNGPWKSFPLRIYLCNNDLPEKDELYEFEESEDFGYEVYIGKRKFEQLKNRYVVEGESPRITVGRIILGLEGVI